MINIHSLQYGPVLQPIAIKIKINSDSCHMVSLKPQSHASWVYTKSGRSAWRQKDLHKYQRFWSTPLP